MGAEQHNSTELNNNIIRHRDTSDLIIELIDVINGGEGYEASINHILEILSRAIHADRLYILEKKRRLDGRMFERCSEGVPARMASLQAVSDSELNAFVQHFAGCGIMYGDTLDKLGLKDPRTFKFFEKAGVRSMLVVPLRDNDRFIGCLGADNYTLDENLDVKRLLETIAPFIATIISNQQLLEELEWSGTHDTLTGLLNRRGIESEINRLTQGTTSPFALALIDIDDFKIKNDLYGHGAGDQALRTIASAMQRFFPSDSVLGRNGGDELAVMITADHVDKADELFKGFVNEDLSFDSDNQTIDLTVSVGYTICPDSTAPITAAFNQADTALYAVKLAGKAMALKHSPEMGLQYRSQLGFSPHDLAENIPGAIMIHRMKPNGEILFVNKRMIDLVECENLADFMEYTDMDYRRILHPDDLARIHESTASQLGDYEVGSEFCVNSRLVSKTGTIKAVASNGIVVQIANGTKVFYVLFTENKERDADRAR